MDFDLEKAEILAQNKFKKWLEPYQHEKIFPSGSAMKKMTEYFIYQEDDACEKEYLSILKKGMRIWNARASQVKSQYTKEDGGLDPAYKKLVNEYENNALACQEWIDNFKENPDDYRGIPCIKSPSSAPTSEVAPEESALSDKAPEIFPDTGQTPSQNFQQEPEKPREENKFSDSSLTFEDPSAKSLKIFDEAESPAQVPGNSLDPESFAKQVMSAMKKLGYKPQPEQEEQPSFLSTEEIRTIIAQEDKKEREEKFIKEYEEEVKGEFSLKSQEFHLLKSEKDEWLGETNEAWEPPEELQSFEISKSLGTSEVLNVTKELRNWEESKESEPSDSTIGTDLAFIVKQYDNDQLLEGFKILRNEIERRGLEIDSLEN